MDLGVTNYLRSVQLRFPDAGLEKEFLDSYADDGLKPIRMNTLLGILIAASAVFFDAWVVPEVKHQVWIIRFGIICPALLLLFGFTFTRHFRKYMQLSISLAVFVSGLGIIMMIALAKQPGNYLYYAGIIITFMYVYTLAWLRFPYVSVTCWLLIAIYEITAVKISKFPLHIFLNNNFFLISANLIGMYANYTIERFGRREFLQNRQARERAAELERTHQQVEAASRAKSEFIANISHELRTPLNSIIGFSEIMKNGMTGGLTNEQKEYCTDIWESGKHLLRLINDILDLSKIEAGMMTLEREAVDMRKTIQESLVLFRERAMRHGITINTDLPPDLGEVRADERKVKQVIFNLVANALKFTPDNGQVGAIARRNTDHLLVTVWDTGIGMAQQDMFRLFRPFQQLDTTLTKQYEGTGLGLHLCKNIVELHGGAIWAESEVGRGSRFHFTIPLEHGHA